MNGPALPQHGVASPEADTSAGLGRLSGLRGLMRIPVTLKVVVGSAVMPLSALSSLEPGSIVRLDRSIRDKVDLVANGRVVARGEIVVLDAEASRYAVSIEEIVDPQTT